MSDTTTSLPLWLAVMALARQATRDPLTGLYNRRYFDETLADHIAAARRYDRELSLVLFDLDQFKQINDEHGHEAGDTALKHFAERLRSTARSADIVCRHGGDEFAVILPETGKAAAQVFVERVLASIENGKETPAATAGIATLPCTQLFQQADADLLERKKKIVY